RAGEGRGPRGVARAVPGADRAPAASLSLVLWERRQSRHPRSVVATAVAPTGNIAANGKGCTGNGCGPRAERLASSPCIARPPTPTTPTATIAARTIVRGSGPATRRKRQAPQPKPAPQGAGFF